MTNEQPPIMGPVDEDTGEDNHPYDEKRSYGDEGVDASIEPELPVVSLGLADPNMSRVLPDPLLANPEEIKKTRKLIDKDPNLAEQYLHYKYSSTEHMAFDAEGKKQVDRQGMMSGFLRHLEAADPKAVEELRKQSIEEAAKGSFFAGESAAEKK